MGQLNNQSDDRGVGDPQAADALLRAMTQDIENLRQNLLSQLSQDIERLQREKAQLIGDIETLKAQRQQQILQQQQMESTSGSGFSPNSTLNNYNENVEQLIASLDATLRATFKTLQQDLRSYQSSLSQQLNQMYTTGCFGVSTTSISQSPLNAPRRTWVSGGSSSLHHL
jgi:predicted RNase H-like nuclease (RuvC/YqgF family)